MEFFGNIEVEGCKCVNWTFKYGLVVSDDISFNQISDGKINGLVYNDSIFTTVYCELCQFEHDVLGTIAGVRVVDEVILGFSCTQEEDEEEDGEEDDGEIVHDSLCELDYSQHFDYTIDSHWNCYCKTRDVCGCGCDSLHDGW